MRDHADVVSRHASAPPPFFIVGNDRSGTTVVRLILDRSREAAVPPESMHLVDFAASRRRGNLANSDEAARLLTRVWNHPKVKLWKLDGEPPAPPAGLGHDEAYRFIVESPYRAYARAEGKERFGDKTPSYLHALDELIAVWPDARIVVVVRDGRDVALSIVPLPFGPNNAWAAARWWADGIRAGRDAARRLAGQVLTVRYEELVADPRGQARRVCEHVGVRFHDDMLAIERSDPAKVVEDQAGWFTNVWDGINPRAVGKWRREMSARDQAIFAAVAGDELAALGYDVEPGRASPLPRRRALPHAVHDAAARGVNFVALRLIRERGRELRYVLTRKLRGA